MPRLGQRKLLTILLAIPALALTQVIGLWFVLPNDRLPSHLAAAIALAAAMAATVILGALAVARITGFDRQHRAMSQADMFRLLINANTAPILVVDEALGTIAYANQAAAAMLFGNEANPIGKPFNSFFRLAPDLLTELLARGGQADRVTVTDGGFYADLRFGPADIDNRRWSMVVVADAGAAIAAEQRAQEAREQLDASLKRRIDGIGAQRDNYRRMVETLKSFTSTLAHEIKNPIAVILAAAQNIEVSTDPNVVRRARRIQARANDMTAIINRVLTAARLEANALAPALSAVDPIAILRLRAQAASDHDLKHSYRIDLAASEATVRLDKDLFGLAIDNLLGNAAKYSTPGTPIEIHAQSLPGQIAIRIVDHGIGIPDDEKIRVFTRYYRASTAKDAGIPGNGLGMALCKEIVDMVDGTIILENTHGGGTTVRITLPIIQSKAAEAA